VLSISLLFRIRRLPSLGRSGYNTHSTRYTAPAYSLHTLSSRGTITVWPLWHFQSIWLGKFARLFFLSHQLWWWVYHTCRDRTSRIILLTVFKKQNFAS